MSIDLVYSGQAVLCRERRQAIGVAKHECTRGNDHCLNATRPHLCESSAQLISRSGAKSHGIYRECSGRRLEMREEMIEIPNILGAGRGLMKERYTTKPWE